MRFLLFLTLLLTSTFGVAQEDPAVAPAADVPADKLEDLAVFDRFYFGVYISPEDAFHTYDENVQSQVTEASLPEETWKFSYTTGVTAGIRLNSAVSLETGIQLSNMGWREDYDDLVFGDLIDPRTGLDATSTSVPTKVSFIQHFEYLGLPLGLRYTSGRGKLRFTTSLGCTAAILVNTRNKTIIYYEDANPSRSKNDVSADYSSFNLIPTVSAGLLYRLNDSMVLSCTPVMRYGALQIRENSSNQRLYNVGLQVGWMMDL